MGNTQIIEADLTLVERRFQRDVDITVVSKGQIEAVGLLHLKPRVRLRWRAILAAAGSDLARVLRCGVCLDDLSDFEKMNRVYAEVFGDHRPARTTVQVASLPDPGLRVEIDAIAYRD